MCVGAAGPRRRGENASCRYGWPWPVSLLQGVAKGTRSPLAPMAFVYACWTQNNTMLLQRKYFMLKKHNIMTVLWKDSPFRRSTIYACVVS